MGPLTETGIKSATLYAVGEDGEYKKVMPIDNIELKPCTDEESYEPEYVKANVAISHLREPITAILTVIRPKMNRRKFKKWLMKNGISRNEAEKMCGVVAEYKGKVSYLWFQDYIYWLGVREINDDLNRTTD